METNWLYGLIQRSTPDPLERLKLGDEILSELSQRKVSSHPKLVNDFLDLLSQWLTGSNFKVTIIGLEIMDAALRASPEVLASYYFDRLSILIERLGDSKQQVREMALNLCLALAYLENSSPVMLLDRLCCPGTGFAHKQWLVKVGSLTILRDFLNSSFALVYQQSIAMIAQLCRLTNDPNSEVRDGATATLVDLMVFGGQPIIARIAATKILNDQKMTTLTQRHQTIVATRGDLPPKPSANLLENQPRNSLMRRSLRSPAKIIHATRLSTPPRVTVAQTPTVTPTVTPSPRITRDIGGRSSMRTPSSGMSLSRYRSSSCAPPACSISQDDFRKAFMAVPKTTVYSNQDVREKLENAKYVLNNGNEDWSKRANQLKLIRSIVLNSDDTIDRRVLLHCLNDLSDAFDFSIRDLRSQIVREAAVTCAFLFETYGAEVRGIAETVLPGALSQVGVSTKIMATSAATLTMFIVQKIQTRQVFSIISEMSNSKSKEQRRQLGCLMEILINTWDGRQKQPILKQIANIVQSLINDADGETRVTGRKAFVKLEQLHPDIADWIFKNLDVTKQKMIREGVCSSSSSVNSDRENNNRTNGTTTPNISQKFLSQRSASAVDAKQLMPMKQSISRPTTINTSRLPKSSTTNSFSSIRSSGYGNNSTPTSRPKRNSSPPSSSSPSSSSIQTPIQRVASNLGSTSFVGSLTSEQATNLQQAMDKARDEMSKQNNEDDDFLLANLKSATPPRNTPPIEVSTGVEHILKGCTSSSINEKRDSIRQLASIVMDLNLTDHDIKQIGDTLTRLLAEGNTTLIIPILETISHFVRIHHLKLHGWLKLGLGKLFSKMAAESLPNVRGALMSTQKIILSSFDPSIQLKAVCDFMCDPIHLLVPKARLALLEYICLLFEEIWPEDHRHNQVDTPHTRVAIRKMFAWMFDPRYGAILMPACERLVIAMFALNAADFTMIFNDLSTECRDWAHRILQLNGQNQQYYAKPIEKEKISNNNYKDYSPIDDTKYPPTKSPFEPDTIPNMMTYDRKSTAHLAQNVAEQAYYIRQQLDAMRDYGRVDRINEAMANIHGMMCEGSFTLWNQFFEELLDCVYQILSTLSGSIRKKLALRILMKMCNAQASKLFDSTEISISKVLDASMTSDDTTMPVAAEDCLRTLATHLPLPRIIHVSRKILSQDDDTRSILILKMLTRMFQEIDSDELSLIIDDIAPCFVEAYESPSSSVRKCAVFGLVALVQRIGRQRMELHLRRLNPSKINLIDLYVGRAKSLESGSSNS